MVAVIRHRGLIWFMLAVAVVSLVKGIAYGRPDSLTAAAVMLAVSIEEARNRELVPRTAWVDALRWTCVMAALAFLPGV